MAIPNGWITSDDLLKKVGNKSISLAQLDAWRKQGLLPSPYRHYLGRAKGTKSYYPPETVNQIRFILKIKMKDHIRRLMDIQTWLWLEAFPIKTDWIKKNLIKITQEIQRFSVKKPEDIPSQVDKLLKEPHLPKVLSGSPYKKDDEIKSVLSILIALMSGLPIYFDPDISTQDTVIAINLEEMIDINKAREDGFPAKKKQGMQKVEPWLPGVPGDYLQHLSDLKLLSITEVQKAILNISEDDLEDVRKSLKQIIEIMPLLGIFQELFGKRFGLSGMKRMVAWGKKNITYILPVFVDFKYHDIDLKTLLSDLHKSVQPYQEFYEVDQTLQKHVTRDIRRKVDREI
jgi:hypothetical protein